MRRAGSVTFLAMLLLLGAAAPAAAVRPDRTPPSQPGTPTVTGATDSTISLAWGASTDNRGVVGYDVYNEAGATDILVGTSTGPSFTVTDRQPNTTSRFYVVARDRAGNVSLPSGQVRAATLPDGTPPTAPGTPILVETTAVSASFEWAPATDNASSPVYYDVYVIGEYGHGVLAGMTVEPRLTQYGLAADREYTYYVVARDFTGNTSPESGRLTLRTLPTAGGATCRARFSVVGTASPFQAEVQVRNMTTAAWTDFTIGFSWPDGQLVRAPWNQWVIQTGADVSIHVIRSPSSGAGSVYPGGQHTEMFYADHSGTNTPPSVITVDGQPCDPL